ncbi:uncharacterized protein LOC112561895 isoform X2 [Pomacea canaliculata]|uniref:uncharacterized protein LOC112561895 isoform X2 n=1 Tax=Pomacea canaliculata TaxID=400727 RepID=UPI000D732B53|nr:uncharacterized protein LOC112561895 isoform X2 [Pomacea canaliculata]
MDLTEKIIALSGTCSGIVALIVYWMYRKSNETADQIKVAETVKLGKELEERLSSLDDHRIAYAAVEGVVKDLGKVFTSKSGDKQGVVIESQLIEHSSRRTQGFWSDVKKILRHTLDAAPFVLTNPEKSNGCQILVTEPTEADNLLEELEVTHNEFTPQTRNIVQASIDRIFGEACLPWNPRDREDAAGWHWHAGHW